MGKAGGRLSCFCWKNSALVVEPARKEPLKHPEKCLLGRRPNDAADRAKFIVLDNQSGRGLAQQATQVDLMQSTVDALEDASRDINEAAANAAEKPAEGAPRIFVNVGQEASAETQDESGVTSTQAHARADATPKSVFEFPKDDNQRTASQETTTASDAKDAGGDDRIVSGETEPYRVTSDQQSPVHEPSDANYTGEHPVEIINEGSASARHGESGDKQDDGADEKAEGNELEGKVASDDMLASTPTPRTVLRRQLNPAVAEFKGGSECRTLQFPALKESSPPGELEHSTHKDNNEREQALEHALEEARPRAVIEGTPALTRPETQARAKHIDITKSEGSQDEESSCGQKESAADDAVSAVTTNSQLTSRRSKKKKKARKAKGKRRHGRTGRR